MNRDVDKGREGRACHAASNLGTPRKRRNAVYVSAMISSALVSAAFLSTAAPGQVAESGSSPAEAAQPPANASQRSSARNADARGEGVPDIIVTAERRGTKLQKTPIAVTAVSGEALAQKQVFALTDIHSLAPSLNVGVTQAVAQFTIRGIGISANLTGAENSVAVNMNEVYISRPVAQLSGIYDVSAIEILRGPQGTLYGRNATAGSINMTTARPTDDFGGFGRVTVGNRGSVRLEGAVGGPVIDDKLLVRVAGFRETNDGYGRNLVTGTGIDDKNAYGVRATVVATPVEGVKATVIGEYYHERDHNGGFHYFGAAGLSGLPGALGVPPTFVTEGGYAPSNIGDVASPYDPNFFLKTKAVTGILEFGSGPLTLKSITGYRDQKASFAYAADGGSTLNEITAFGEPAHQFSQEITLNYVKDKLKVTAGGFYFRETDHALPLSVVFSSDIMNKTFGTDLQPGYLVNFASYGATLTTDAKAAYIQGTYQLTDSLSLTAGVRYSDEKKGDTQYYSAGGTDVWTGNNPLPPGVKLPGARFKATTPHFGLQYQITPRVLAYASYTKGFKAGGFDLGVQNPIPFKQEKLTSYEVGLKVDAFDRRLRANIAAYYYDYKGLQVQQVVGLAVQTANAATARIYGFEGEFTFQPTQALSFNTSLAYTNARYRKYVGPDPARPLIDSVDFSGNSLSNAPDFQGTGSVQYSWQMPNGHLDIRGEVEYSSRFYFSPGNLDTISQAPFAKGNIFLTYYPTSKFEIGLFVKNIADLRTRTSAVVVNPVMGNPIEGGVSAPRLFGATAQYKF